MGVDRLAINDYRVSSFLSYYHCYDHYNRKLIIYELLVEYYFEFVSRAKR